MYGHVATHVCMHATRCIQVDTMFAPPGTDLLLGSTKQRQIVLWQHNSMGAYRTFRKHDDWVEAVVVVKPAPAPDAEPDAEPPEEEIYSAGADGKVLRWALDVEQNCDIYQCVEEYQVHQKNIYCILYSPSLDCLITGGEDATIQLHYLSGVVPTFNEVPLPTYFADHEGRIAGLALIGSGGTLLASISADKTLRTWDLTSMKPLAVRRGRRCGRATGHGGVRTA